jgi:hypothetical protein
MIDFQGLPTNDRDNSPQSAIIRKMSLVRARLALALLALAPLLTSCPDSNTGGGFGASGGSSLGGSSFLATKDPDLSKWFSDRFAVDYKHMTPQLIFNQVPLNEIYYETSNLPTSAPSFTFASEDISRRDLLRKIAEHWRLKMSLSTDQAGKPIAVRVEG